MYFLILKLIVFLPCFVVRRRSARFWVLVFIDLISNHFNTNLISFISYQTYFRFRMYVDRAAKAPINHNPVLISNSDGVFLSCTLFHKNGDAASCRRIIWARLCINTRRAYFEMGKSASLTIFCATLKESSATTSSNICVKSYKTKARIYDHNLLAAYKLDYSRGVVFVLLKRSEKAS